MDNDQIKRTIEHFKDIGDTIRVRDIAYTLLSKMFADSKTAYQCLFGTEGYDDYAEDEIRSKLEQYMSDEGYIRSVSTDADTGGITFEQNRREMEILLEKTQQAMDDGLVDPKDALKIMADIRVKLNDKFKVESKQQARYIVVQKRYNNVCPHCNREIYIPSKQDLMEEYGLTEKQ